MSYSVMSGSGNFCMSEACRSAAMRALLKACSEHKITLPVEVLVATDIVDALNHLGFEVLEDDQDCIVGILPAGETIPEITEKLLEIIAPFVRDGSYQMFIGEDQAQWAWVFDKNEEGVVTFHEEDVICVLDSRARAYAGLGKSAGWREVEEKLNER